MDEVSHHDGRRQCRATAARLSTFAKRVGEFADASTALGEAVLSGYAVTLAKPGFHHFIAYDAARPVAVAALVKFGDIGYLTHAGTVESDRGRGAQSALIAHRVALAQSLGCARIVSPTLTMLRDSFANRQRAGFREIYEQEVYECSPMPTPQTPPTSPRPDAPCQPPARRRAAGFQGSRA